MLSRTVLLIVAVCGCGDNLDPTPTFDSVAVDGDLRVQNGNLRLVDDSSPTIGPEIHYQGNRGTWSSGIDVANNGGSRDFVLASKRDWPQPGEVADVVYLAHNDTGAPTVGIGVTPPDETHMVQIAANGNEPAMGSLLVHRTPQQTGNLLTIVDSSNTPRWWLDADFWLHGAHPATAGSLAIKADSVNQRPLVLAKDDGTSAYGFQYDDSDSLFIRYFSSAANNIALHPDGRPSFPNGLTTAALRVESSTVPPTSTSPCTRGDLAYDDSFVYVCVATDTWKRSALSSW